MEFGDEKKGKWRAKVLGEEEAIAGAAVGVELVGRCAPERAEAGGGQMLALPLFLCARSTLLILAPNAGADRVPKVLLFPDRNRLDLLE